MQSLQCPVTRHKHNKCSWFVTDVLQHASDELKDVSMIQGAFRGSATDISIASFIETSQETDRRTKTDVRCFIWVGHLDTISRAGLYIMGKKICCVTHPAYMTW